MEMPTLEAIHKRMDNEKFTVLGIHVGPGPEAIENFLRLIQYPSLFILIWIWNTTGYTRYYDLFTEPRWRDDLQGSWQKIFHPDMENFFKD